MQRICTYLLEGRTGIGQAADPADLGRLAMSAVEDWLAAKGASDPSRDAGTYDSIDNSRATYKRNSAIDGLRRWDLVELEEITESGRVFRTSVSVTVGAQRVFVLVTMEVGSNLGAITRVDFYPKCPSIVRELLSIPGGWRLGNSPLQGEPVSVVGDQAGALVAQSIQDEGRAIPFVVVSNEHKLEAIEGLSQKLAFDLAGLANVVAVDFDASWALTMILGKAFSTYGRAVRIYWPNFDESTDSPYRHQLWTADRLNALQVNPLSRFRRQVRELLMEASAISVTRPPEIDEIRTAESRAAYMALIARSQELDELKASASSLSDFEALAETYARDNDILRRQIGQLDARCEQLETELQESDHVARRLRFQLQQAGAAETTHPEIAPAEPERDEPAATPASGEVRYYKKRYSSPKYDVLQLVGGCNHNSWQRSNSADKARKGLERLGLSEWKKLEHCGSCTGGGLWRVEW